MSTFRRWAKSDDFPDRGSYSFLNGELWVDPSMERIGHDQIKTKVAVVLTPLVEDAGDGRFIGDRMPLTNMAAKLSTEPDGMFFSHAALKAGRVRAALGRDTVEVEGSPDMVLEVVSPASKQKDKVVLRELYCHAGIPEYWLIEPGRDDQSIGFDILRRGAKGYTTTRKQDGWVKSVAFERMFRITAEPDPAGLPICQIEVR